MYIIVRDCEKGKNVTIIYKVEIQESFMCSKSLRDSVYQLIKIKPFRQIYLNILK